jgi:hypothetical protein
MKTIILAAALAIAGTAAHTQNIHPMSSESWQRICDPKGTNFDVRVPNGRCEARLLGEIDGVLVGMRLSKGKPWICMPDNVDEDVRRGAVERYLNEHPEASSEQFGEDVAAALSTAYPCRNR